MNCNLVFNKSKSNFRINQKMVQKRTEKKVITHEREGQTIISSLKGKSRSKNPEEFVSDLLGIEKNKFENIKEEKSKFF